MKTHCKIDPDTLELVQYYQREERSKPSWIGKLIECTKTHSAIKIRGTIEQLELVCELYSILNFTTIDGNEPIFNFKECEDALLLEDGIVKILKIYSTQYVHNYILYNECDAYEYKITDDAPMYATCPLPKWITPFYINVPERDFTLREVQKNKTTKPHYRKKERW